MALLMDCLDFIGKTAVFAFAWTVNTIAPGIITTGGYSIGLSHCFDIHARRLLFDVGEHIYFGSELTCMVFKQRIF